MTQTSVHGHPHGVVLFLMIILRDVIIEHGRENVITLSIAALEMYCILLFSFTLKNARVHVYVHVCRSMRFSPPSLKYRDALLRQTHYHHWRDCLFDCFQRESAKSLLCDYHLIICLPKCLSSTISRFFCAGLSGGWASDWQLVNDVIRMLLGKWSSSDRRLVEVKGMIISYGWCVAADGCVAALGQRNCPTILRLKGTEESKNEGV